MAVAWETVGVDEIIDALREVDWTTPPRSPSEFFLGPFKPPKDAKQVKLRLKLNTWYYRTNYLIIIAAFFGIFLLRRPLALISIAILSVGLLCQNDSFAVSLNGRLTKLIRRMNPQLAVKLRLYTSAANTEQLVGAPGLVGRRRKILIAGVDRTIFAGGIGAFGLFSLYYSGAVFAMVFYLVLAVLVVAVHAVMRTPNLKARFASARENFVASWKGLSSQGGDARDTTA